MKCINEIESGHIVEFTKGMTDEQPKIGIIRKLCVLVLLYGSFNMTKYAIFIVGSAITRLERRSGTLI